MDLRFTDPQRAIRDLAREILGARCTPERLKEVEAGPERFDRALWAQLARAHLTGVGIGEEHGGAGGGFFEVCILLEEQGRTVAPVPVWPVLACAAPAIAAFGTPEQRARLLPGVASGEAVLTAAVGSPGDAPVAHLEAWGWAIDGVQGCVAFGEQAAALLVPARAGDRVGLFLVDPAGDGVALAPQASTSGEPWYEVTLRGARAEALGGERPDPGAPAWLAERATVGLCALQVGLAEEALRLTAAYTSGREQFGRSLGTFQAVQQRAADAYIDVEAIRLATWQAAWRLSEGLPAAEEAAIAKWWAAEAGQRVVAAAQHLHGGIGVDVEYPLWRYTVWSKQCELLMGGAAAQLSRLGELIAG